MKKLILLFAFSLSLSGQAQTHVWVSPDGNDVENTIGDKEHPFATLEGALQYVRQMRQQKLSGELGEVHVILREGVYALAKTVKIDQYVGGTPLYPTIIEAAEGEVPILSGGIDVGGWTDAGDVEGLPEVAKGRIWKMQIPIIDGKAVQFRHLWVNGTKMRRASTFDDITMPQIISADKEAKTLTIPRPMMDLSNANHLELYIPQDWALNIMRVTDIKHENQYSSVLSFMSKEADIEFKRPWPILRADYGSHSNHCYYLANAIELLNRPQEWYNDVDNNVLYYWPRYGETKEEVQTIIPRLETLVDVCGTLDQYASNIKFRNIIFEHTTWMRPTNEGHVALQAGQYLFDAWSENTATANNVAWVGRPAAGVSVQNANNITFDGCQFRHMGSTGLDFVSGTRNVKVNGCIFSDIAGNGISGGFFGDESFEVHQAYNPEDLRVICDSIFVTNNYLTHIANEDWGCIGVGIGFAANVNILHNEIVDAPYSAISLGWGWIHTANIMHDNHIDYNYINGFAKYMRDTGGIYTLSPQPNSTIKGNWIDEPGDPEVCPLMWDMKTAQFDIYTDEGTDYYTVTDNWCSGIFSKNQNGSHNTWGTNSQQVSDNVKANAGLEDAYKHIKDMVKVPSYAPVDSIGDLVYAEPDQVDYIAQNDGFKLGHAIAVDLNNDILRDIVYSGGESYQVREGGVRINTGNYGFVATQSIMNANLANLAAGDLNGDGHIDLVQAGFDFWDSYNAVLMNDGTGKLIEQELSASSSTSPACGIADINNDALPDYFFVGGSSRNTFYTQKISRNGFNKSSMLNLPDGFNEPHMMYADFDNNKSVDICLLSDQTNGVYTKVHYNDGTGVFTETNVGFKEKGTRGGMAYADVNSDGWLDVVIGGELVNEIWSSTAAEGGKTVSLYLNNGDGTFTLTQEFSEYMQDNVSQPIRFCDWDNDGYSDLIIAGWNMSQGNIAQTDVYLNDGTGHFIKSAIELPGASEVSLELADFTGQGRNDILISGNANGALGFHGYNVDRRLAVLCKNKSERTNTSPLPPSELTTTVDGNTVKLAWNNGSDAETPTKSLSYNYYLRNLDTGVYLTYPNSDVSTGIRQVTAMGNAWLNSGWDISRLPKGRYAWSVQTVDAGYAGSVFAAEQTFVITEELPEVDDDKTTKEKLLSQGWIMLTDLNDIDIDNHYFAMLDAQTGLTVVALSAVGDKNWSNTYAMYYSDGANPNSQTSGVFCFDDMSSADNISIIISPFNDPNRHFRTESWSVTLWQTYSDVHKQGNSYAVDGNRTLAMITPEYFEGRGWAFKNKTSNGYVGPWVNGAFEDGAEFAADKHDSNVSYFELYAIPRIKYLQNLSDFESATMESPADITRLLNNPSFGRYDENRHPIGWILNGDDIVEHESGLADCDYYAYMTNVTKSGKLKDRTISQTVDNLPKGWYRVGVYCRSMGDGAFLFANNDSIAITQRGNNVITLDFEMKEEGSLSLGLKLRNYQRNSFRYDNFTLHYLGTENGNAIQEIEKDKKVVKNNAIYDISGKRLPRKRHGYNIINGKVVYLK